MGELSEQMKIDYTLVLKGHIALAVPSTRKRGAQLDVLAQRYGSMG